MDTLRRALDDLRTLQEGVDAGFFTAEEAQEAREWLIRRARFALTQLTSEVGGE